MSDTTKDRFHRRSARLRERLDVVSSHVHTVRGAVNDKTSEEEASRLSTFKEGLAAFIERHRRNCRRRHGS